ncbi:MAG: hypothetical protein DDT36_00971 [Firmicutes bacterium]|nr:hypothetical protein [Bacillota bacterium]
MAVIKSREKRAPSSIDNSSVLMGKTQCLRVASYIDYFFPIRHCRGSFRHGQVHGQSSAIKNDRAH